MRSRALARGSGKRDRDEDSRHEPSVHCVLALRQLQRPQRERRDIFDEDSIARDGRLGPGRAVGDSVPFQRFESIPAAPRHNQLTVVVQQEQKIAGLDDGGIRGLTGLTEPQNLAGLRVEREELASRLLGQAEQGVADDDRIAQKQRDILGLPHDVDVPLAGAPGRLQRGHAHGLAADDQRLVVQDRRDGARRRAGRPRILPEPRAIGERDTENAFLGHRHDLTDSTQLHDDRRGIRATIAAGPFDGTRVRIERGQRAVIARVDDDEIVLTDWRHGRAVRRMLGRRGRLPRDFPG